MNCPNCDAPRAEARAVWTKQDSRESTLRSLPSKKCDFNYFTVEVEFPRAGFFWAEKEVYRRRNFRRVQFS